MYLIQLPSRLDIDVFKAELHVSRRLFLNGMDNRHELHVSALNGTMGMVGAVPLMLRTSLLTCHMTVTRAITNHFLTSRAESAWLQHTKHVSKLSSDRLRSRTAVKRAANLSTVLLVDNNVCTGMGQEMVDENTDFRTAPRVASDT